jgi:hypothetical protein
VCDARRQPRPPNGLSYGDLTTHRRFGFLYRCALETPAERGPAEHETREATERLGRRGSMDGFQRDFSPWSAGSSPVHPSLCRAKWRRLSGSWRLASRVKAGSK